MEFCCFVVCLRLWVVVAGASLFECCFLLLDSLCCLMLVVVCLVTSSFCCWVVVLMVVLLPCGLLFVLVLVLGFCFTVGLRWVVGLLNYIYLRLCFDLLDFINSLVDWFGELAFPSN